MNSQTITFRDVIINFEIDSHRKTSLLEGLDDIELTLKENEKATEIAEMLGDSESAIILDAAERLLEQSRGSKLAYSALKEDAKKYSTAGLLIPD